MTDQPVSFSRRELGLLAGNIGIATMAGGLMLPRPAFAQQIGRASCRERVS
jgi:hypothetical protein